MQYVLRDYFLSLTSSSSCGGQVFSRKWKTFRHDIITKIFDCVCVMNSSRWVPIHNSKNNAKYWWGFERNLHDYVRIGIPWSENVPFTKKFKYSKGASHHFLIVPVSSGTFCWGVSLPPPAESYPLLMSYHGLLGSSIHYSCLTISLFLSQDLLLPPPPPPLVLLIVPPSIRPSWLPSEPSGEKLITGVSSSLFMLSPPPPPPVVPSSICLWFLLGHRGFLQGVKRSKCVCACARVPPGKGGNLLNMCVFVLMMHEGFSYSFRQLTCIYRRTPGNTHSTSSLLVCVFTFSPHLSHLETSTTVFDLTLFSSFACINYIFPKSGPR